MRTATLVDAVLPPGQTRAVAIARDVVLVVSGTALVAACAQISIPWHPVPLTGQTFAVLLVGGLLGMWRGIAALALYWLVAVMGLPVLAGGDAGWAQVTSPSGGYVLGFILAAGLVGYLAERGATKSFTSMIGVLILGNIVIYAIGVPWLAYSDAEPGVNFGWTAAYDFGIEPFLAGDIVKLLAAAALLPAGWKLVEMAGLDRSTARGEEPSTSA
jgi:biotin transport system substrate-specific component